VGRTTLLVPVAAHHLVLMAAYCAAPFGIALGLMALRERPPAPV